MHKGDHVYRQHDAFLSIFAVRSGSVKSYSIDEEGDELVTGFYFPGEVLGMDGIGQNRHESSAIALETSSICEIPFNHLGELSLAIPTLQHNCFQLMSQEIVEDRRLMALLSKRHA
ncbi:MAG: cyclic nucleotide-binding domain-containing protein, partial [Pseudomonadales bacterium]